MHFEARPREQVPGQPLTLERLIDAQPVRQEPVRGLWRTEPSTSPPSRATSICSD